MTLKQGIALVAALTVLCNLGFMYLGIPANLQCTLSAAQAWVDEAAMGLEL